MAKISVGAWLLALTLTIVFSKAAFALTDNVSHHIYRSRCRRDALFKSSAKDMKLSTSNANVIAANAVKSLPFCAKHCTEAEGCVSINYKKKPVSQLKQNCQLLSVNLTGSEATLQPATGWRHYEPVSQIGPRCRNATCSPGSFCVESCNNNAGYECQDIDECQSNPCKNNATCENGVNAYICNCPQGYTGTQCESEANECLSSPCYNSGTCLDEFNGYKCQCKAGYTGSNCQTNINECASNPCPAGHLCSDSVNRYSCYCPIGYTGSKCDENINECASNPCRNGGTCNDRIAAYTCSCLSGYTGSSCLYTRCGTYVSGSSGTITSPGYPNNYPIYRSCRWTITVSSGRRVEMAFSDFYTYNSWDYVQLWDFRYSRIVKLSYRPTNTGPYYSTGNVVLVDFFSSNSGTAKGFSLSWKEV